MNILTEFFTKMTEKDAPGLAELFNPEATFDDFCISGVFPSETHLIGKEAIDMHFSNRFVFRTYLCTGYHETEPDSGEMDVLIVGKPAKAAVRINERDSDGRIRKMTVTPA